MASEMARALASLPGAKGVSPEVGATLVALDPALANMFGYDSDLKGATSGTASFSMEFSHYAEVAEALADIPKPEKK